MHETTVKISIKDHGFLDQWEVLWRAYDANSFFRSPVHLRMITQLTGANLCFAVASDGDMPVAALALAVLVGPHGPVINSLPYYGTCSAVIGGRGAGFVRELAAAVLAYGRTIGAVAVTFVDDWRVGTLTGLEGARFQSYRTNQFIDLAALRGRDPLNSYHQKTRNLVRKAEKLGVVVRRSEDVRDIGGLAAAHRETMVGVNGIAKPESFFAMLRDLGQPLCPHRLYIASIDGRDCGFLLNFHCGDTVEYYMPAVHVGDRPLQPLNLLIHRAICEAVEDGYRFWNFGGTWPTQDSLRHFKIRWGSQEKQYSYFTYVLNEAVLLYPAKDLLEAYPYFFVAPFDQLRTSTIAGVSS